MRETVIVEEIEVYGALNLRKTYEFLTGEKLLPPLREDLSGVFARRQTECEIDFADVKEQFAARRAVEVAVAGGHNLLMLCTISRASPPVQRGRARYRSDGEA